MSRRQHGTGSITERADGRLVVRVFAGRVGGQAIYWHESVRGTTPQAYREARAVLKRLLEQRRGLGGQAVRQARQSLGDWLTEYIDVWCQASARSKADLRDEFTRCIPRDLRARPLRELTSAQVQAWVNTMRGTRGVLLAPVTRAKLLTNLRTALGVAVDQGRVVANVSARVQGPERGHREQQRFTAEQARTFLNAASADRLYAYFLLMLKRATRPSELVALKWSDLAGDRLTIQRAMTGKGKARVEGDTKTNVVRRLVLDVELRAALERHRASQARRRLRMGARYEDRGYIFATATGRAMDITGAPNKRFHKVCEDAALPRMNPYNLKHTCVSLLLEAGASPAEVQKLVGWTSPQMVLRYMAAHPDAQARTAAVIDRVLTKA